MPSGSVVDPLPPELLLLLSPTETPLLLLKVVSLNQEERGRGLRVHPYPLARGGCEGRWANPPGSGGKKDRNDGGKRQKIKEESRLKVRKQTLDQVPP